MEMQRLRFEALQAERRSRDPLRSRGPRADASLRRRGSRWRPATRRRRRHRSRQSAAATRLSDDFAGVALGIAHDVPDPEGGATLIAGSDPIRIGSSNFVTFSPVATATSGTLYLAARHGPQVCVRILGATGRVEGAVVRPGVTDVATRLREGAERRLARRLRPEEAGWQRVALLRPGHEVEVVNLTAHGALVQSSARLKPGTRSELQLIGATRHALARPDRSVTGRQARTAPLRSGHRVRRATGRSPGSG